MGIRQFFRKDRDREAVRRDESGRSRARLQFVINVHENPKKAGASEILKLVHLEPKTMQ